jgi:hypothetical protein
MDKHALIKLSEIKPGDRLISVSGERGCIDEGQTYTVAADASGNLFFQCRDGHHYLDGHLDAAGMINGFNRPAETAP